SSSPVFSTLSLHDALPILLDCVGCAFGDDEGALPVVLAIEQDENFAPVDMAKGLPRISGTAAYPHPHHIHRSAEIDHFEACTLEIGRASCRERGWIEEVVW